MSWRFYPIEGFPHCGLLQQGSNRKPVPAEFLTPQQAKALAERKASRR
jgi:hypothetical protein